MRGGPKLSIITPRIEIKHSSDLSPIEKSAIEILTQLSFQHDPEAALYQWAVADWHVLVLVETELISTLEIVERMGLVGKKPVRLGGDRRGMHTPRLAQIRSGFKRSEGRC
jgi:hypothetical protein